MKATGVPDGVERIVMGEDGRPQGVGIVRVAREWKPVRWEMPVPPIMARGTGSLKVVGRSDMFG